MKRLLFIVVALIFVLASCNENDNNTEVIGTNEDRDLSNVKTSLFGHWLNEKDDRHYYISDGIIMSVDGEGVLEKNYKIVEHDEIRNLIRIQEKGEGGSSLEIEITFNNDRRESAEVLLDVETFVYVSEKYNGDENQLITNEFKKKNEGKIFDEQWSYVDDKQVPNGNNIERNEGFLSGKINDNVESLITDFFDKKTNTNGTMKDEIDAEKYVDVLNTVNDLYKTYGQLILILLTEADLNRTLYKDEEWIDKMTESFMIMDSGYQLLSGIKEKYTIPESFKESHELIEQGFSSMIDAKNTFETDGSNGEDSFMLILQDIEKSISVVNSFYDKIAEN